MDTVLTSLKKSKFLCAVANAFPNRCSESPAPYLRKRRTYNARTFPGVALLQPLNFKR